jgi:beta-1,4-N-acetylgalactosaminyltransferase 2
MVRTARRVFDGRIIMADDSRNPMASPGAAVEVVPMPFNSGVSRGRNAALDAVDTELVLVTDDDIVFTAASRVGRAMRYLDEHPDVDLVGFLRVELPRRYAFDHGPDALFPGAAAPLRPWGEEIGGLPVRLKVEQVYLARTSAVQRVRWDEQIRMVDHNDFFTRASGCLVAVLDHGIVAYHARPPFDAGYTSYREDVADDLAYLSRKWRG